MNRYLIVLPLVCSFFIASLSYSQSFVGLGLGVGGGFNVLTKEIPSTATVHVNISTLLTDRIEAGIKGTWFLYDADAISTAIAGVSRRVNDPFFATLSLNAHYLLNPDQQLIGYGILGANYQVAKFDFLAVGPQNHQQISPDTGIGLRFLLSQRVHVATEFSYYWRKSNPWQAGLLLIVSLS